MLENALSVFLGIVLWALFNAILDVPRQIKKNRERKKIQEFMQEAKQDLVNFLERSRQDEQKAKPTVVKRGRTSSTRTTARQRSKNTDKPVRSGRKGTSKKASNKS